MRVSVNFIAVREQLQQCDVQHGLSSIVLKQTVFRVNVQGPASDLSRRRPERWTG
ncbi:MAG: hypothetical protein ACRDI2_00675 [Chloroflexota bacterium]